MYFPFNQEELTQLQNQSKETNMKSIVQSFSRPLFHSFLASVRAGLFVVECEVLRYRPTKSMTMAEWHRHQKMMDPLQEEDLTLFTTHKTEIEAELARLFPTATIEFLMKLPDREQITTITTPHYRFTWSLASPV